MIVYNIYRYLTVNEVDRLHQYIKGNFEFTQ